VHGFERADLSDFVEMLLATDGFDLQDPIAVKDALDTHRSSKAGFSDCLVLAVARRAGALARSTGRRMAVRPSVGVRKRHVACHRFGRRDRLGLG
jgi:predicted nucleic-acid-binding protein